MKLQQLFGLVLVMAQLGACATMLRSSTEDVQVTAYPARSKTTVQLIDEDGNVVCDGTTPARVTLKRSKDYVLKATPPGYRPMEARFESETSGGWTAASFFFMPVVGLIVDLATGSLKGHPDAEDGFELTMLRQRSAGIGDVQLVLESGDGGDEGLVRIRELAPAVAR